MGGKEKSGTPKETRRATSILGDEISRELVGAPNTGGIDRLYGGSLEGFEEDVLGRLTTSAQHNLLGFGPGDIPLTEAVAAALADPTDVTEGLFRSLQPFEERETARQVGGQREAFGGLGGRFSRNLLSAESMLRGELASGFARERYNKLLEAGALRNQAVANVQNALLGAGAQAVQVGTAGAGLRNQRAGQLLQFLQPGAPIYDPGLLPGLLSAGATLGASYLLNRGGGGGEG